MASTAGEITKEIVVALVSRERGAFVADMDSEDQVKKIAAAYKEIFKAVNEAIHHR